MPALIQVPVNYRGFPSLILLFRKITQVLVFYFEIQTTMDYSQDTRTIANVIKALYEVISGEEGEEREWDRDRNLFLMDSIITLMIRENAPRVYCSGIDA